MLIYTFILTPLKERRKHGKLIFLRTVNQIFQMEIHSYYNIIGASFTAISVYLFDHFNKVVYHKYVYAVFHLGALG